LKKIKSDQWRKILPTTYLRDKVLRAMDIDNSKLCARKVDPIDLEAQVQISSE